MGFPIVADSRKSLAVAAAVLIGGLPLVRIPFTADVFEAPRTLLLALATGLALLAADRGAAGPHGRLRQAAVLAALLVGFGIASAAHNGWASGVVGVHGRFQALISLVILLGAGLAGALVLRRHVRVLALVIVCVTSVQAVIVLAQTSLGIQPVGLLGNRVPAGASLAIGASVAVAMGLLGSGRARALYLSAAGLGALSVGLTGSRGAWLGLFAGVAVAFFATSATRTRKISVVLGGALIMAAAVGAMLDVEAVQKLNLESLASGSASSRWQIWRASAAMIADHPVLGVGPGRFVYVFPRYQSPEHAVTEAPDVRADQAHSLPLHAAVESGVLAGLAWIGLAGLASIAGVRGIRARDGAALIAAAGFAAYAVQGLFGVTSMGVDAIGWSLGGILVGGMGTAGAGAASKMPRQTATAARGVWAPGHYVMATLSVLVAGATVWYLAGDMSHARALARFASADFEQAQAASHQAIATNPLVDVYRVALADSAMYLGADAVPSALATLDEGLKLEPASYDLLLARARLLERGGAGPEEVARAYRDAVASYPLGMQVNREAAAAYRAAGYDAEADAAENLVRALENRDAQAVEEAVTR